MIVASGPEPKAGSLPNRVTSPGAHGEDLGELARSEGVDLIVLGPTHRGAVGRVVPGATPRGRPLCGSGRSRRLWPPRRQRSGLGPAERRRRGRRHARDR